MQQRTMLLMCLVVASCGPTAFQDREPDIFDRSDAGASAPASAPTWWGDVEPIVRENCHLCHGMMTLYGAPMSLVEYDDAYARHELMVTRIHGEGGKAIMPPPNIAVLTSHELDLIARWSAAGAPEGVRPIGAPDAGKVSADAGLPINSDDAGATMSNPEEPYGEIRVVAAMAAIRTGTRDEYGCFRTIVQIPNDVHAVEATPVIDQPAVVHHLLLFRDNSRTYPDQKTGLLCAADTLTADFELLHGWAPGGGPLVFPAEAGVRIKNGDYLVVQIHYNNPNGPRVIDNSGMIFKTTEHLRANDAAVVGVGTQLFSLPAGQQAVSRSGTCTLTQTMHAFGYSPHMHLLGSGAKLELIRDGQTTVLGDVNFAFESQVHYPLDEVFQPGDALRATCTWNTTARSGTTFFGEGTADEMCYIFVAHYPPIGFYACTR